MSATRGFTLLEVLVALSIMALAFTALLRTSGLTAEQSAALRLRLQAGWVAENILAQLQLQADRVQPGRDDGLLEQDRQPWLWQQNISETADPLLLRVELSIQSSERPGYPLAQLSTLLARKVVP